MCLVQEQTLLSGSNMASRTLPAHCSVWMECSHLPLPEPHQELAQVMQHLANDREASHARIQGSHFRDLGKACILQNSPRSQRWLPFLLKTPGTPWGCQRSPSRAPSFQTQEAEEGNVTKLYINSRACAAKNGWPLPAKPSCPLHTILCSSTFLRCAPTPAV